MQGWRCIFENFVAWVEEGEGYPQLLSRGRKHCRSLDSAEVRFAQDDSSLVWMNIRDGTQATELGVSIPEASRMKRQRMLAGIRGESLRRASKAVQVQAQGSPKMF